jgi:hypothetical protein
MLQAPSTATAPPTNEKGEGASTHQQTPEAKAKKPNSNANSFMPVALNMTDANPSATEPKNINETTTPMLNMPDPSI